MIWALAYLGVGMVTLFAFVLAVEIGETSIGGREHGALAFFAWPLALPMVLGALAARFIRRLSESSQ